MAKSIVAADEYKGLNEVLRNEYREGTEEEGQKGKYVLKVDNIDGWGLENITGLKNSLGAVRGERDLLKRQLSGFGEDLTPEKVRQSLEELERLRKASPSEKVTEQIESAKKQLLEKHQKELDEARKLVSIRDSEVSDLLVKNEAIRALTAAGAEKSIELLLPHVINRCKVVRDDSGKLTVQVLGDDGNARVSLKSGNTGPMDIAEFVGVLKANPVYAPGFPGSKASGTGADGKGANGSRTGSGGTAPQEKNGQPVIGGYGQKLKEERRAQWSASKAS